MTFSFLYFYIVLLCPLREIRSPYLGTAAARAALPISISECCYPFQSVSAIFPCVQTTELQRVRTLVAYVCQCMGLKLQLVDEHIMILCIFILSRIHFCLNQCMGFFTCAQLLRHVISHGGCTDTVRVCTGSRLWQKNPLPHQGLEPASVLRLAFQSDTLPTELCHSPRD